MTKPDPHSTSDKLLKIRISDNLSSCFFINGQEFGFPTEILTYYAHEHNLIPVIIRQRRDTLAMNHDFEFTLNSEINSSNRHQKRILIHKNRYALLANKTNLAEQWPSNLLDIDKLNNKHIRIAQDITNQNILNCLKVAGCSVTVSTQNPFMDMVDLNDKHYDYLVCGEEQAVVGCGLIKNVCRVLELPDSTPIYLNINSDDVMLSRFDEWFESFKNSKKYKELCRLYLGNDLASHIISQSMQQPNSNQISNYDHIIKRYCEQFNYDWRFISAIIYNESKFNEFCVSNRGAKGLMQVMPSVAASLHNDSANIMNPEHNILLGIKVLRNIEKIIKLSPKTPQRERLSLILACYNCGIGHILDIRELAKSNGKDPDNWDDILSILKDKSLPFEKLKYGKFDASETVVFVRNVLSTYDKYCQSFPEN